MDLPLGSEDPAILQLHKWDPSDIPLGLSEFREAFLSPTRAILLLHSYQREALLLPLIKGDSPFFFLVVIVLFHCCLIAHLTWVNAICLYHGVDCCVLRAY